jgi:hypothetical protein
MAICRKFRFFKVEFGKIGYRCHSNFNSVTIVQADDVQDAINTFNKYYRMPPDNEIISVCPSEFEVLIVKDEFFK